VIAAPRPTFTVPIPGRAPLVLGPRTLVMGVVNVTPDSFSDGGRALDPSRARDLALEMEAAGADLIDVGAESTRPGARPVGAAEELARVEPAVKAIGAAVRVPISIDTYKTVAGCINGLQGGYVYFNAALRILANKGPKYNLLSMPAVAIDNTNLKAYAQAGLPLTSDLELPGPKEAWCDDTCLDEYFNEPGPAEAG